MSWGSTLHAAAFFAALAIVFLYLHREYRLPHHLLWLLAWAFLVVRALAGLFRVADAWALGLDAGLVLVSSSLLLLGALSAAGPERLGRGHAMRVGAAIGAGFLAVLAVLVNVRPDVAPIRSATFASFVVLWIASGWAVDRYVREFAPLGARAAGLALVMTPLVAASIWIFAPGLETVWQELLETSLGLFLGAGMIVLGVEEARTRYAGHRIDPATLFEDDPNMILVFQDGRVTFVNRAFAERTGRKAGDFGDGDLARIVPPEDRERFPAPEGGRGSAARPPAGSREIDLLDAKGGRFPVLVVADPLPWRGRQAIKYEFIDVTGRRRAEDEVRKINEELQHINRELERSNEIKSEFLSNTSHELKTPLTSIIANTEILEYEMCGPVNEEQRKVLANISRNSQHLLEMISRLLDFARHEEGHATLRYEKVDLRALVEGVVDTAAPLTGDGARRVAGRVDERLGPCYMDGEKIYRVFLNLVENAIKFSREGEIFVEAERVNGEVEGRVIDHGIGIPEDKLTEVFDAFRQVEPSQTRAYQGVGLGLAICKQLVEMHGGRIWAESRVEEGTVMRFRIPYHETLPATSAPAIASPNRA
ncbi:MAG TPA: PAS domain-containing sensor histidine kinase [Gemmatimonadota bacterium]|nr:PAS domain-containing sensor histidine kinase [Gemmatimonadota bacterium]